MSYKLLAEPIRKYIRDKRWTALRAIQAAAIPKILASDNNYVLASRTASGKTEAAFLPILTKADFNKAGVQVLYISPLIALINDQFYRIEDLCKYLEISVTKWHGEAKKSLKTNLVKNPNGIVLITPESIEAMLINAPYQASTLFGNLHYIVIDEIHSFLGADRGLQLMSLLARIQQLNTTRIVTVGLSATIGNDNYIEAKRLIGDIDHTKILLDKTPKKTIAKFKYFECGTAELSLDLLKSLYKETASSKALIFPNSRGRAEEVAVKLRKISNRVNGHEYYYSHHSSVDKEIRESIEHFAKNNERFNFCISCTSTLELGIDIGTVDQIVQIDSTHSVASLVQRIGRSGRREGAQSMVSIYATDKWSLLQSLACWELYKDDFLEPIHTSERPFDILFHQLLSIVKQLSGCTRETLKKRIRMNPAFQQITDLEVNQLIDHCVASDYLEDIERELIIGLEGEQIVNSRGFYSVFKTESNLKVICAGKNIGEIPHSPQVKIDENILLAAKIWKIKDIDLKSSKIIVIPARDGKKPIFFGSGGDIHRRVREKMLQLLKRDDVIQELDENSQSIIDELRYDFKEFNIEDFVYDCPVIKQEDSLLVYTFTGSKMNKSLNFLMHLAGYKVSLKDTVSCFEINIDSVELPVLIQKVNQVYNQIDDHLMRVLDEDEAFINFSKWGSYLPLAYQIEIVKERYFEFDHALDLINHMNPIVSIS